MMTFVGDNQAINRVDSSKTRNRGTFSGSLTVLVVISILLLWKKLTVHRELKNLVLFEKILFEFFKE